MCIDARLSMREAKASKKAPIGQDSEGSKAEKSSRGRKRIGEDNIVKAYRERQERKIWRI